MFSSGQRRSRYQEAVLQNNCFISDFMKNYSKNSQTVGQENVKTKMFNFGHTCKLFKSVWLNLSVPNNVQILEKWFFFLIVYRMFFSTKLFLLLMGENEILVTWHVFFFLPRHNWLFINFILHKEMQYIWIEAFEG